jgi:bifunctional non-homologous end joining protein LigD
MASKPPSGPDWVHEIKHDGYRMIVRRDGPAVRLYSRNGHDWTGDCRRSQLPPERIKAKSFTIDGVGGGAGARWLVAVQGFAQKGRRP